MDFSAKVAVFFFTKKAYGNNDICEKTWLVYRDSNIFYIINQTILDTGNTFG